MKTESPRKIRVLINPNSGSASSFDAIQEEIERGWDQPEQDITYQFSRDAADGQAKARRAVAEGVDTILVAGGDGMINSIGSELLSTDVALGVIPTGSGNGFARHFNIPLNPAKAVQTLVNARRQKIDVGVANGRPFFVTCSMAWDAALVRTFEKFPIRGVLPYVFAGVYEYLGYDPQPLEAVLDDGETLRIPDPVVFTVANLTQFGGGARIAPTACPDDGYLEVIIMRQRDWPRLLANINRLFDGTLDGLDEVMTRRCRKLTVRREKSAPLQMDGELCAADRHIKVDILHRALTILAPAPP
ncbi:MAG: diacylglycerol kinase family lipid kinase [Candidatus Marinimicrobia bacterium]|nr:diacylglycerol kinase family lipid kinase [Candidatus Neomarinimicrobiota bacterium]